MMKALAGYLIVTGLGLLMGLILAGIIDQKVKARMRELGLDGSRPECPKCGKHLLALDSWLQETSTSEGIPITVTQYECPECGYREKHFDDDFESVVPENPEEICPCCGLPKERS